ncbi:hypothetical protein EKB00_10915 [Streptococcus pseudopneumoniae]|nr:hypothetical protein [Streptococcus pseudopneumoniae]NIB75414.1 hypothetical protein [Streptococcus pseudopneumoniae]
MSEILSRQGSQQLNLLKKSDLAALFVLIFSILIICNKDLKILKIYQRDAVIGVLQPYDD